MKVKPFLTHQYVRNKNSFDLNVDAGDRSMRFGKVCVSVGGWGGCLIKNTENAFSAWHYNKQSK